MKEKSYLKDMLPKGFICGAISVALILMVATVITDRYVKN